MIAQRTTRNAQRTTRPGGINTIIIYSKGVYHQAGNGVGIGFEINGRPAFLYSFSPYPILAGVYSNLQSATPNKSNVKIHVHQHD